MEDIISRLEATNDTLSSIDELYLCSLAKKIDLQIESLERERDSLVSQRKRCRGILSPFRKFPAELLGEIFSWAVTENSGFMIPTKLSQICKRWRDVVLNSPELWTNLAFSWKLKKPFEVQKAAALDVISTSVRRARNQPMSLSVSSPYSSSMPELLTVILQATTSVQWKSIKVHAENIEDLRAIFDQLSQSLENSTSMTAFNVGSNSKSGEIIPGGIDIRPLANLRSLSIDLKNSSDMTIDTARIPWSQITSLTMTTKLTSSKYLDILRECVNLVTCSIEPYESSYRRGPLDEVDTTQKVYLPQLTQLKLHHAGDDVPLHILIPLVAPSLEEFTFSIKDFPDDLDTVEDGLPLLSDFIIIHAKSLRRLSVSGAFASWNRNPLYHLQTLKHLRLTSPYDPGVDKDYLEKENIRYSPYWEQEMLELLILEPPEKGLTVPLLESFELVDHPFLSEASQDLLAKVVSSRSPGHGNGDLPRPRHLRRVVLGFWTAHERAGYRGMKDRMKAFREKGVQVEEKESLTSYVLSIV